MNKLLLNEEPLLIMPQLAVKIGLNESIILQQFHYWAEINRKAKRNFNDGFFWTYNSYSEWHTQFPFWSEKTIYRTIKNLEKAQLVAVSNYNKVKIDRTKWYRVDYEVLEILETSPFGQIDYTKLTEWLDHLDNFTRTIPETSSETSSKTNNYINLPIDVDVKLEIYNNYFEKKYNKNHKLIKRESMEVITEWLSSIEFVPINVYEEIVEEHFINLPKANDGGILAFIKASMRYFEVPTTKTYKGKKQSNWELEGQPKHGDDYFQMIEEANRRKLYQEG